MWRATITKDITIEDTLKADFWAHHADRLDKGNKIEALWEDMSRYASYIVLSVGTAWVKVVLLEDVSLSEASVTVDAPKEDTSKYVIKFSGQKQWCIYRKTDGERLKSGYLTEGEANVALTELAKEIG